MPEESKPLDAPKKKHHAAMRHLETDETEFLATLYSGPLPPPSLLAKFEEIQPGLVERIVAMAEKQAQHRQSLEIKKTEAIIADQRAGRGEARLGQILGFLIGIVAIIAGAYAATVGAHWPGAIIGGGGVVALVSVFVLGRRDNSGTGGVRPADENQIPDARQPDKESDPKRRSK